MSLESTRQNAVRPTSINCQSVTRTWNQQQETILAGLRVWRAACSSRKGDNFFCKESPEPEKRVSEIKGKSG